MSGAGDQRRLPGAGALLLQAATLLARPPYLTLLALSLFVTFVSGELAFGDAGLAGALLLWVVVAYIQIAVILAAAAGAPSSMPAALLAAGRGGGSADPWIREAFKRRCFLRFFLAQVFSLLLVAMASLALLIPGFLVGAAVALAPVAAVLGYEGPAQAVRRSIELTKVARWTVGIIFGVAVMVPNLILQIVFVVTGGDIDRLVSLGLRSGVVLLDLLGTIALTKAFLHLGGTVVPRTARPALIGDPDR